MHHVFIAIVICKGREDQHNHSEMWDASGVSILEYYTEQKTKENELCLCENPQCVSPVRQERITLRGESQS